MTLTSSQKEGLEELVSTWLSHIGNKEGARSLLGLLDSKDKEALFNRIKEDLESEMIRRRDLVQGRVDLFKP